MSSTPPQGEGFDPRIGENERGESLYRETVGTPDGGSSTNSQRAGSAAQGTDSSRNEDVEVEVVLLGDDEAGTEEPQSPYIREGFQAYWVVAAGIGVAVAGALLFLRLRSQQQKQRFLLKKGAASLAPLKKATPSLAPLHNGKAFSALHALTGAGDAIGTAAGQGGERARALAARARIIAGRTPPPPPKRTGWDAVEHRIQEAMQANRAVARALLTSIGLTAIARLVDTRRPTVRERIQMPAKKGRYRIGPWK